MYNRSKIGKGREFPCLNDPFFGFKPEIFNSSCPNP